MNVLVTKTDLKGATGVDISMLALKSGLASIKAKVDKMDMDKAKPVPAEIIKLCNAVDNYVFEKLCIISWSQK